MWDILGLDVKALTEASEDPDVRAAVGRFASLAKDNTTGKRLARELRRLSDERSQMLAIIREVLLPLTGQEIMKVNIREYPESVVIGEPVHRIHLGIGSPLTWHGAPDGRCAIDLVNVDAVEEEEDSSGSKTPVEMKMSAFGRPNIKVLGNAVIFSFVQQKRHPTTNPLVPVMGISGNQGSLLFAAYDASSDILLHSVPTSWLDFRSNQFNLTGLFLLSLGLHHRALLTSHNKGRASQWATRKAHEGWGPRTLSAIIFHECKVLVTPRIQLFSYKAEEEADRGERLICHPGV